MSSRILRRFLQPKIHLLVLATLLITTPGRLDALPQSAPEAPAREELAAATYQGIAASPLTLVDGHWEGEPAIEGGASVPRVDLDPFFRLAGDLDGDGKSEAVALLHFNFGGSGVFSHLAVMGRNAGGGTENLATTGIGDRVQLRSAAIDDGVLTIETVEAGPGDGACCPGLKRQRTFTLDGPRLVKRSTVDLGRLSIADLSDVTWRLTHWGRGEPVADGVEIDLVFDDLQIAGQSGCNRYRGTVATAEMVGELTLASPLQVTRMACTASLDEAEARYLEAVQQVRRFRFAAGHLLLDWSAGESWGSLVFAASSSTREERSAASPSFDCARAESAAERLVCEDPDLAALDRRLDEVYGRALRSWPPEEVQTQKALQRGWIKGRDECWKGVRLRDCVAFAYRLRIVEIQIQSGQLMAPNPVLYACSEDEARPFYATFYSQTDPPSAVLTYGGDQVVVFSVRAASGAKYSGRGVEFWEHQGEATIDWYGTSLTCMAR